MSDSDAIDDTKHHNVREAENKKKQDMSQALVGVGGGVVCRVGNWPTQCTKESFLWPDWGRRSCGRRIIFVSLDLVPKNNGSVDVG